MKVSRRSFLLFLGSLPLLGRIPAVKRAVQDETPFELGPNPVTFASTRRTVHGPAWIYDIVSNSAENDYDGFAAVRLIRGKDMSSSILTWAQHPRASFRWTAYLGGEIIVPEGGSVTFLAPEWMKISTVYRREAWKPHVPVSAGTPGDYADYERRHQALIRN